MLVGCTEHPVSTRTGEQKTSTQCSRLICGSQRICLLSLSNDWHIIVRPFVKSTSISSMLQSQLPLQMTRAVMNRRCVLIATYGAPTVRDRLLLVAFQKAPCRSSTSRQRRRADTCVDLRRDHADQGDHCKSCGIAAKGRWAPCSADKTTECRTVVKLSNCHDRSCGSTSRVYERLHTRQQRCCANL